MKLAILLVSSLLYGFTALGGYVPQDAKQTLPGKLVFDDSEKHYTIFAGEKGKVDFDHAQHVAKDSCVTCHHTNSDSLSKAIEEPVARCTACHKMEDGKSELEGRRKDKTFKGKDAVKSEDAFHGKGSLIGCIGCHQTRLNDAGTSEEIKAKLEKVKGCTTCHQR